ncbi:hypothetical protein [Marinagarivorans algicola]|uniref:hypothetical protein n=1 Tax=Marinagarivorans algicola TaxID=1513270 RepID=UPI0006B99D1B|nr:hypothetical protein [Marinagarivorans algicola]
MLQKNKNVNKSLGVTVVALALPAFISACSGSGSSTNTTVDTPASSSHASQQSSVQQSSVQQSSVQQSTVSSLFSSTSSMIASSSSAIGDQDSDQDGIIDSQDDCPQTEAGAMVDNKGCAVPAVQPPKLKAQKFVFDDQSPIGSVLAKVKIENPDNLAISTKLMWDNNSPSPFSINTEGEILLDSTITAGDNIDFTIVVMYGEKSVSQAMTARIVTTQLASDQRSIRGTQKALWILPDFNGHKGKHTPTTVNAAMETLNAYIKVESYDQLRITWEQTPFIPMNSDITEELSKSVYGIRDFVIDKAKAANPLYDSKNFDFVYLGFPSGAFSGGGALGVRNGNKGTSWIGPDPWTPGIVHESFHMFGVGHAEVIMGDVTYPAPTGSGGHDPYYFMGSEGGAKIDHGNGNYTIQAGINVPMKYRMGWLTPANIQHVTGSGVYRIQGHRLVQKPGLNVLALKIKADGKQFMVAYEPDSFSPRIKTNGLVVHLFTGDVSRILDAKPSSVADDSNIRQALNEVAEFADAAIVEGETMHVGSFFDVTLVKEGGEGDKRWADIRIDWHQ